MKILVTGATGLVGKHLCDYLMNQGHDIHYLTTRPEAVVNKVNYHGYLWDVEKGTIDPKCIKDVQVVVHLAGETVFQRWTKGAKQRILNSRVDSTRLISQLLEKQEHQVKHVITASAIGIYPDDLGKHPFTEDSVPPIADNYLAHVCDKWEQSAVKFQELGLKHAIVRIGVVLAAKGGALEQMARPVKLYAGAAFGNGKMWQSWIAIDDLTKIFSFIIDEQLEGVYNGVAPQPVRNKELVQQISSVLNKPVFLPNVPKFVLKVMLGEMSSVILASQHASSAKIQAKGFQFEYPTLNQALTKYLK